MVKIYILLAIGVVIIFSLIVSAQNAEEMASVENAVAVLYPTTGNNAHGIVTFSQSNTGVKVVADMEGLTPGKHGFHIHEYGDCSSNDATSSGAHFNPENRPHGAPTDADRHVGDLGNITADNNGKAHLEITDRVITFDGPHSIIGRAVIVHALEDDLKTDPSGNAGPRVACGVIGIGR